MVPDVVPKSDGPNDDGAGEKGSVADMEACPEEKEKGQPVDVVMEDYQRRHVVEDRETEGTKRKRPTVPIRKDPNPEGRGPGFPKAMTPISVLCRLVGITHYSTSLHK